MREEERERGWICCGGLAGGWGEAEVVGEPGFAVAFDDDLEVLGLLDEGGAFGAEGEDCVGPGGGGGLVWMSAASAVASFSSKGRRPVVISYSTTPAA